MILPKDAAYDAARRIASFNPLTDKRPAIIVRCVEPADVARAVEFGRSAGLEIAVRGGGHDVLGQSVCEGGLLIDLATMRAVRMDREREIATVQAGLRAGELNDALHAHGYAAILGCNPGVGIAGLTLGGGLGWLLGRFGAACDNLVGADVVVADGRVLHASSDENTDLFWGLRGGGGNFGIVTSFEYRVHPVDRVIGGYLAYSGARLREFLRFYRDYMASAPDELTVEIVIMAPRESVLLAVACYSGDERTAERVLAPLRSFGPPMVDTIAAVPYARLTDVPPAIARMFEDGGPSGPGYNYWKGATLNTLSEAAIDALDHTRTQAPPGWSIGLGHYLHGGVCRVDPAATPFVRQCGTCSYHFSASWRDGASAEHSMFWVDRSMATMAPLSTAGTYINYLSSNDALALKMSYGGNYSRLVALKRKFDPNNVFHLNRNIRPSM